MNRFILPLVGIILAAPASLSAQVVDTPDGAVEFIGLERWTIPMIRDSMAVHAPGEPLGQCAAVLRQLGFVSASARLIEESDGTRRIVVTVVEPHRADRIRLRTPAGDSLPDREGWRRGIETFTEHNQAFQPAIQWRGLLFREDSTIVAQLLGFAGTRAPQVQAFWRFLEEHRSPADLEQALRTLEFDRNRRNAAVAAAILTNFPDEPRAWWALMDAQRDSRNQVAATASQALLGLLSAGPREIDWAPAAPAIRALLNGTNVFVLGGVLEVLAVTGLAPGVAAEVLRDGGAELVLARLGATDERTRGIAHAALVRISGNDYGTDRAAWAAWVHSL
jgi:hypothetical protein